MALDLTIGNVANQIGIKPTTGTPIGPQPIVGVKAASPTSNIKAPANSLTTAQTNPVKDLSGTYANVGGTIYNKSTGQGFSTPQQFFSDAGVNSFNNLKFDTGWTPPNSTPAPSATPPPNTGTLPQLLQTNSATTSVNNSSTTPSTTPAPSGPYTPPNQGTTGVSQGGIVGNLIGIANNESPQVTKARADLQALQDEMAKQTANIEGSPIDLSLATGQEGILNRLFATKLSAAQTALQNALTSQGQSISANQAAGGLNAPIVTTPGAAIVSPSAASTTGATTSGSTSLSSLIGQRPSPTNPSVTEYYNTQTGQGFATPQQLADFVNQQMPGAGANASNVFQLLSSGALNSPGANIVGATGNTSGLNPISQVNQIAQQVLNGQISPSQAQALGGNVGNWQSLLNQALIQANGGTPPDTSALQARYDSNQQTQTSQANQVASYKSSQQQATNLGGQLKDLLNTYGLNPSSLGLGNSVLQLVNKNLSDPRYQTLNNLVTDLTATYTSVLGSGGTTTDLVRNLSASLLDPNYSGPSLQQVINSLDSQVQAKIAGIQTPSTTGGGTSNTNSQTLGLF